MDIAGADEPQPGPAPLLLPCPESSIEEDGEPVGETAVAVVPRQAPPRGAQPTPRAFLEAVHTSSGTRTSWSSAAISDIAALVITVAAVSFVGELFGSAHRLPSGLSAMSFDLAWLVPCLPILALALAPSRKPAGVLLRTTSGTELRKAFAPLAAATLVCIAAWEVVGKLTGSASPGVNLLIATALVGTVAVASARVAYHNPISHRGRRARRVIIVGSGAVANRVRRDLETTPAVQVLGFVDDRSAASQAMSQRGYIGPIEDLAGLCDRLSVDHIVVAFSRRQPEELLQVLRPIQGRIPMSVVPNMFDILSPGAAVNDFGGGFPLVTVSPASFGWWPRAAKRAMDLIGATLALAISAPFLVLVAIAIKLTSPGPALLRQDRVGKCQRLFAMYKLRTMRETGLDHVAAVAHGEQAAGPFPKLKSDPRVTTVGRLLRRLSIDELPQLLNVLAGSMSLVGPRPFLAEDAANIKGWALRRYQVRPGMTGLWQVSGRNELEYEEMCRLDYLYVSCWSLGLDVKILIRTLRVILTGHGAY